MPLAATRRPAQAVPLRGRAAGMGFVKRCATAGSPYSLSSAEADAELALAVAVLVAG